MGQTWAVEKTLLQPGGKLGFCWADLWWCFWCRVSLPAIWRIWSSSPNLQEFNGWLWPLSKWLHQMSITPQVIHVFSTLVWVKYKLLVHEFQKVQPDCIPVPPTGSHTWFLFILHVPFTSGYEHWIQKWGSYKQSNQHGNIETRYTPKIFNMKAKNHHIWNWTSSSKPAFFWVPCFIFQGVCPPTLVSYSCCWGCCACWICGGPSPQQACTALALVDIHRGAGSVVWDPGACNGWDDSSLRACECIGVWKSTWSWRQECETGGKYTG